MARKTQDFISKGRRLRGPLPDSDTLDLETILLGDSIPDDSAPGEAALGNNFPSEVVPFSTKPQRRVTKNLNWNALYFLKTIVHYGSFSEAAAHLGRTQAHLSNIIDNFESLVGYRVLERWSRGVTLTRQGAKILQEIAPFLSECEGILSPGVFEDGKRCIRIVSTHAVMSYIMLKPLMAFEEAHPGLVKFDMIGDDVHLDLERHDADIVIRPHLDETPYITQVPLFTLTKRLYASQSYLDRHGTPQSVEDLRYHKFIAPGDRLSLPHSDVHWTLKLAHHHGADVSNHVYRSNTLECSVAMAEEGMGIIGVCSEFSLVRNSRLVNIFPEVSSEVMKGHLIHFSCHRGDDHISKIREYLKNYFSLF